MVCVQILMETVPKGIDKSDKIEKKGDLRMESIELWLADIRELVGREDACLPLLTPKRRTQAQAIKPERERLHCIAAGLLLRRVLGITADEGLVQDPFGKRYLAGNGPCFNLSHGGNYAVLALAGRAVGVDIEPVGEKLPIAIPRRYLLPDELAWLEEAPSPQRFAHLWTRLESALKADGRGFGLERREFSVLSSGKPWYLETILYDGHCISCALDGPFEIIKQQLPAELLLDRNIQPFFGNRSENISR